MTTTVDRTIHETALKELGQLDRILDGLGRIHCRVPCGLPRVEMPTSISELLNELEKVLSRVALLKAPTGLESALSAESLLVFFAGDLHANA